MSNYFALYHDPNPPPSPIQNSESPRQSKTTPRHLPDTLHTPQNRALNGQSRIIERKGTSQFKQYSMLLKWSFVNLFGMITLQAVFRVTQTTSRHLRNTLRHLSDNLKSYLIFIIFSPHAQFLAQFFFMQMRKNWPLIATF